MTENSEAKPQHPQHTGAEREALIARYADGPRLLREAFDRVPEAARHWRPAPGKWSVHQVIVHCGDSETNAAMRIRYVVAGGNPVIQGYDQDLWASSMSYDAHPLEPAWAAIDAVRANTVPLLRRLTDEQWASQATHSESGPYGAAKWLESYAEHLEIHTRQILRNLAAWEARAGGA